MSTRIGRIRSRAPLAYLAALVVTAPFAVPLGGCTAALGVIGAARDSGHPRPGVVPREQIVLVRPGAPMTIHLKNSSSVTGRYGGTARTDAADYRARFDAWRGERTDVAAWPTLGDSVLVYGGHGTYEVSGTFEGISASGFLLGQAGGSAAPREIRPAQLDSMTAGERRLRRDDWSWAVTEGGTPLRSTLVLVSEPGAVRHEIGWGDVESISIGNVRHSARDGMLLGLLADVVILAAVSGSALSSSSSTGCESSPGLAMVAPAPGDYDPARGEFVAREAAPAPLAARAVLTP